MLLIMFCFFGNYLFKECRTLLWNSFNLFSPTDNSVLLLVLKHLLYQHLSLVFPRVLFYDPFFFFSLYINDLPLYIETLCELFADDTSLYSHHTNLDALTDSLQHSIDNLIDWTEMNHMALHPDKTKFMLITTRQKRQNLVTNLPPLTIKSDVIEEVQDHKVLGITIDNNLSWTPHVNALCKKISTKVFQLSRLKHFVNFRTRKLFFTSHIQSLIDY